MPLGQRPLAALLAPAIMLALFEILWVFAPH